jgi:hypothetical protein
MHYLRSIHVPIRCNQTRKHVNLMCISFMNSEVKFVDNVLIMNVTVFISVFMTSYDFRRIPKITKRDYELRHICLSVCRSVNLSVRMQQFDCQWTDIREFWYLNVSSIPVEKTQVSLKSDSNNGYFIWRSIYIFYHISLISSYIGKCFRQNL